MPLDSFLLSTKLQIPPRLHRTVPRQQLIDALEHGIPDHKLGLVSAPAGYGKTTLIAQWVHSSRFLIAWLSLGEEDDEIERFLRYLMAAWGKVKPDIRESPLGILLGGISPDTEAVLSAFINAANDLHDPLVFVLDDYHLLEDAAIHNALSFLLEYLPPTLHFVLITRTEPPLPLARYRAHHDLLEFHAEDLQFSQEETACFLNQVMSLHLAQEEIAMLQNRLEGWVAGLQLGALSLKRRGEVPAELVISGKQRFIADFLSEDVLAHLSDDLRRFLLQTSLLERLCGSLCDAVTGSAGSQAKLATLEKENLFLVPLDDTREWFRYHRLFADFLYEDLNRQYAHEIIDLHRRAARWHLDHDLPEQAIRHAVAGNDADLAIEIFERYYAEKLHIGEFKVLNRWFDSFPGQWHSDYPSIGLFRAGILLFTGALDAGIRRIDEVEQRLIRAETKDRHWQLARISAFRCFVACFRNDLTLAEKYAARALLDLPEDDLSFRADIYHALGDTYRGNGQWRKAQEHYLNAADFAHAPGSITRSVHVYGALADLELRQGRLRQSAMYWRKALAVIERQESWGSFPLPLVGWVYIRLSELLYESNDLGGALTHLFQGLERAELGGDVRSMLIGYLISCKVKLMEGGIEAATNYLEQARVQVESAPFPDCISRFERLQLELWLAQGRLKEAFSWADEMLRTHALDNRPESETAQLAIARVLIVTGDVLSLERAHQLLESIIDVAEVEGRKGVLIEALAIQALGYWHSRDAAAMPYLERALRMAEPEGYIRLFADFGLPMAWLLQEAYSRAVMPEYIKMLLPAFSVAPIFPTTAQDSLPEPLTPREQEVLELVAAGLTNREIAEKLVVSPETVKKHTGTIYGKLGASNRTEAAAKARALNLLH
jgi:LuxR family transcriptional regulator, maltose regulon positive regulatory protein